MDITEVDLDLRVSYPTGNGVLHQNGTKPKLIFSVKQWRGSAQRPAHILR